MNAMAQEGLRALLLEDQEARRNAGLPPLGLDGAGRLTRGVSTLRDFDNILRSRRVFDKAVLGATRLAPSTNTGAPLTIDRALRTVGVVWTTGARSRNFVQPYGWITEELDLSPSAVRMGILQSGTAPVLNTHQRDAAAQVLGRVVSARIEGGRGYATLQFSAARDVEPVWARIAEGTLRAISAGYRVYRYGKVPDSASGETIYRAVDWEPYEISVVPIAIDRAATIE
jgi:hypothetical protein